MRSHRIAVLSILLALAILVACALPARAHSMEEEVRRIAELMELKPGMHVADVGAGNGEWSEQLAPLVGESGRIYVNEIDEDEIERIRRMIRESGRDNLVLVEGETDDTRLPDDCCDAILLRFVYHHITERQAMRDSLRSSLRAGGLILVVERGETTSHGIRSESLIEEMTGDGFRVVHHEPRWGGHEDHYAVVFRPSAGPALSSP